MDLQLSIKSAEIVVRQEQALLPDGHPDKVYVNNRITDRPRFAALVGRQIIKEFHQKGQELMYFAWVAYRDRLWIDPNVTDPQRVNFEDFRDWWNYVCDDPTLGVTKYSNVRTLAVSFATGLAPWLAHNKLIADGGQRLTPEEFLHRAGHGKVAEINGAWWRQYKELESVRHELAYRYPDVEARDDLPLEDRVRLDSIEAEVDTRLLSCVRLAIDPHLSRDGIADKLEGHGWRERRVDAPDESELGWEYTKIPASEKTFFGVWVPNRWVQFFEKVAGKFLSVAPDRPDRILPTEARVKHEDKVHR